jgi:hypothetical protein
VKLFRASNPGLPTIHAERFYLPNASTASEQVGSCSRRDFHFIWNASGFAAYPKGHVILRNKRSSPGDLRAKRRFRLLNRQHNP